MVAEVGSTSRSVLAVPRRNVTPATCVALGLVLFFAYSLNGRSIGAGDTAPTALLAMAVAQGDGLVLDRYGPILTRDGSLPYWATQRRGHFISVYPPAAALLAAPFAWLQIATLDLVWPSWRTWELPIAMLIGKNCAAALVALFGVALLLLLTRLGYERERRAALVAGALGTGMWAVASQSLWQHGPAALALTVGILAAAGPPNRKRALLVGLASGIVFACRIVSCVYVAPLVVWLTLRRRTTLGWLLLGALPPVVLTLAYNVHYFDDWQGGIVLLEGIKATTHGVAGRWSTDVAGIAGGVAGTLFSPSRGLFVYSPWVALSLLPVLLRRGRASEWTLEAMLIVSLVPSLLVLGAYSTWWAGWSFGPRFWIDATPIFAIAFASALVQARDRGALRAVLYSSVAVAVAIQAIGSVCHPSSWNSHPTNIDHDHARLWSWTDSELTRCLHEGLHPGTFRPLTQPALESALGIPRTVGTR
ncbi:MAG: hypothetical protein QNK03_05005 [Myxococcota bacterium]|nr:hypothetical protein [Myxococcota bacterium]